MRYVGEPIAMVVAETSKQAKDALEAIFADIDPLPAVTTARKPRPRRTHPCCTTTRPETSAWTSISATPKKSPPPSPRPRM